MSDLFSRGDDGVAMPRRIRRVSQAAALPASGALTKSQQPDLPPFQEYVWSRLKDEPQSVVRLVEASQIPPRSVVNALQKLRTKGFAQRSPEGWSRTQRHPFGLRGIDANAR
jgi:predicted Rossmann fold nucleotide-binding protein DprA/Smf involved in DNA uptake